MVAIHDTTQQAAGHFRSGIRPFDIGRDLRPVAKLIADAFSHELDDNGRAALRELRILSYMGGLVRLLSRSTGDFQDVFNGFVWIEDGQLVGNVTIQKADSSGHRWQIANVAVAPAYRGRGISRALMEAALQHIYEIGGTWAVLQVRANNAIARGLYERLGFESMGGHVNMFAPQPPRNVDFPDIPNLVSIQPAQSKLLYDLVVSQYNPEAQWWRMPRRSQFQLTLEQQLNEWMNRVIGKQATYRKAVQTYRDRFDAAVVLTARRWRGPHEFKLWVRPPEQGRTERLLVQWVMATLQAYPLWPVRTSLSTTHQEAKLALEEFGFQTEFTLLTMRRLMRKQA